MTRMVTDEDYGKGLNVAILGNLNVKIRQTLRSNPFLSVKSVVQYSNDLAVSPAFCPSRFTAGE